MYQVTIKGKGAMVDTFREEGIFVTFGDNAPDTLKDFCYSIDVNPVDGEVTPGCKLVIDGKEFKIVKVGEVANENLKNLGHITLVEKTLSVFQELSVWKRQSFQHLISEARSQS